MQQSNVPVSLQDICCNSVSHEDSEAILDKFRVVLSYKPKKLQEIVCIRHTLVAESSLV